MDHKDEEALRQAILALASECGRFGYRRITVKLWEADWQVSQDRAQRIWRQEGLKVPQKQKPRGRLWLNDGSCVRLRPDVVGSLWGHRADEMVTHDGQKPRLLVLIDEYMRRVEAPPIRTDLETAEMVKYSK